MASGRDSPPKPSDSSVGLLVGASHEPGRTVTGEPVASSTVPVLRDVVAAPVRRGLPSGLLWRAAGVLLVLLGPAMAWVAHQVGAASEQARLDGRLAEALARRAQALEVRLSTAAEVLQSLRGLFAASKEVTAEEFAAFTDGARDRHPGVDAFAWAPRDGARWRVRYVEPLAGHEDLPGLDLRALSSCGAALERALEGRMAFVSEALCADARTPADDGAFLMLGLSGGARAPTAEGVDGVAIVTLRLAALLADAWGATDDGLSVEVFSRDAGGRLLLERGSDGPAAVPDLSREARIEAAGNGWALVARPTRAFLATHRSREPWLLAATVFLGWEVLAGGLLLLARGSRRSALQRQGRLVRSVLRSLGEGVVVADREGRVRLANAAARRLLPGLPHDGEASGTLPPPVDLQAVPPAAEGLRRAVHGEAVAEREIALGQDDPAGPRWLAFSARPLVDEDERSQGGVLVLRDVTERRTSEAAAERLSRAVEQTGDGVLITDRRGAIQYANPAFERMTGYTLAEVAGQRPRTVLPGEAPPAPGGGIRSGIRQGGEFRGTVINRRKDGRLLHVAETVTPMRDATGEVTHFVSVWKDMTDRRLLEERDLEMRLAAEVQRRLYPPGSPTGTGLDVAGAVVAAEATCGDYYDFLRLPGHALGLVVGDVCGHGLAPALVMAETRAYVRSLARAGAKGVEILRRVNEFLQDDLSEELFVTLALVHVDLGTREVVYASAGHEAGFVMDAAGDVRARLEATGPALGLFADAEFQHARGPQLAPGDVLVLVTDGVVEAVDANGELLGEERFVEIVRRHRGASAARIVAAIHEGVGAHVGGAPPRDDVTVVVCRVPEEAAPGPDGPTLLGSNGSRE